MTDDLDSLLAAVPPSPEAARPVVPSPPRCRHPRPSRIASPGWTECARCGHRWSAEASRAGRRHRDYGVRAELSAARTYGGLKVGHAGGPVDVRGAEWDTQVRTHRREPPREWAKAFAGMAQGTRLPRLLVRFVHPGGPTDFFVVPARAWLDWHGRDE